VEIEVLVAKILPVRKTMLNAPGIFDRVLEIGSLIQWLE